MNFDQLHITAFALEASGAAARALSTPCTLTLQLPTAAQACSPGDRPLGSVVKIEIDGKPVTKDTPVLASPMPAARPALLTLTF
jgi:hypothetical protein